MQKELEMDQEKEVVFKASAISAIALNTLGIKTLDTQNSDRLDFHDLAVGSIRAALNEAYEAGKAAGKKSKTNGHQQ
jgi:hypothetical protein